MDTKSTTGSRLPPPPTEATFSQEKVAFSLVGGVEPKTRSGGRIASGTRFGNRQLEKKAAVGNPNAFPFQARYYGIDDRPA